MRITSCVGRSARLVAGVLAMSTVVAGCGGSKSSSSTGSTGSTTATLNRLEVQVTGAATAQAPATSLVARLGQLVGWPAAAEAAVGLRGCTVTASTLKGVSVTTNTEGRATLVGVVVPATVFVTCPNGSRGEFQITGVQGAVVSVRVEARPGRLEVKARHGAGEPSISEPSGPSQPSSPSVSSGRRGSNS